MSKYIEVEARWVNLDPEETERKIKEAGAEFVGKYYFREWIFWHDEWVKDQRRVRVRTDGEKTWLTYKANASWAVDSTEEVEIEVPSAEDAVKFIQSCSLPLKRNQEKKIVRYKKGNALYELNYWPEIPMVLEIEANTEAEIKDAAEAIGVSWSDALFIDQRIVHLDIYGIDLNARETYLFKD